MISGSYLPRERLTYVTCNVHQGKCRATSRSRGYGEIGRREMEKRRIHTLCETRRRGILQEASEHTNSSAGVRNEKNTHLKNRPRSMLQLEKHDLLRAFTTPRIVLHGSSDKEKKLQEEQIQRKIKDERK